MVYFLIFVFKIIEDALATLRLIVVSNGKKVFGAVLQFVVTLIWLVLTGTVLLGIREDIFKAIAFSFGALAGSYLGSYLEEKIALGTNLFKVEVKNDIVNDLEKKLNDSNFDFTMIKNGKNKTILEIRGARKRKKTLSDIIFSFDKKAVIISEKIRIISASV